MAVENLSIAISLLGNLLKLFHFINAVLLIAKSNFAINKKNQRSQMKKNPQLLKWSTYL